MDGGGGAADQAQIEADKIAKMKELLQKGDAAIPRRSTSVVQSKPLAGVSAAKF